MTHSDHRLGWTLPALPLGPAIKRFTLRDDTEWKAALRMIDFETKDYSVKTVGVDLAKPGSEVTVVVKRDDQGRIVGREVTPTGAEGSFRPAQLEPIPTASTPVPAEGEWVRVEDQPVSNDALVFVRFGDGTEVIFPHKASYWSWDQGFSSPLRITHYRLAKP